MIVVHYFLLFMIYSILGWLMEIVNHIVKKRNFVNRGFLIGPYCPIYGCGGILITVLLTQYVNRPLILFIFSILLCATLEYFTSYIMEKLFKAHWWDYSHVKYNLHGRICLDKTITFGLLGLIVIYVVNPFLYSILNLMTIKTINVLSIILLVLVFLDYLISLNIINKFQVLSNSIRKDNTEEIKLLVRKALLKQYNFYSKNQN